MKKGVKVLLGIVVISILVGVIFFTVDFFRAKNNQKPVFCLLQNELNDGGTKIYIGLGYKVIDYHQMQDNNTYYNDVKIGFWNMKYEEYDSNADEVNQYTSRKNVSLEELPKDYSSEQAIIDGCLIISNNNKIYNKSKLDEFLHNTSANYTEQKKPSKIRIIQYTIEGQMINKDVEYREDGKFIITTDFTRDDFSAEEDRIISSKEYSSEEYYILKSTGENLVEINLVTNEGKAEDAILICTYPREAEIEELPSFYAKISEISQNSILVETLEGEEERINVSDKYSFQFENADNYDVGAVVKVTYTGMVMESYPAQINVVKLEKIELDDFSIVFENSSEEKTTILDSSIDGLTDYNVYSFKGKVFVIIDEKIMSLRNAILDKKITMDDIINKATSDENLVKDTYLDGGSVRYNYKDYVMIKCNTLNGNKDVYFGNTDLIL